MYLPTYCIKRRVRTNLLNFMHVLICITLKIQLQKLVLPHCDISALWPGSISWAFFWLFLLIQNVAAAVSTARSTGSL